MTWKGLAHGRAIIRSTSQMLLESRSLVADIVRRDGTLNGVFHCAGALRDRTLLNKSRADLDAVLAPKVHGALALADACKGLSLDRFVLFSSLAGAVGNAGQGDYAAANGFLDAFAEILRGTLPAVSRELAAVA